MPTLSETLDQCLLDLAWSLWTELGVAGVYRKHQQFLIAPEELILLTSVLGSRDPRLRDEAMDWCSRNHQWIAVSRLKTLAKAWENLVAEPFSLFAATLNALTKANWPLFIEVSPRPFKASGKSQLPNFENPALLLFRLRALFGVGARADVIAFFLAQPKTDYAISDTTEIGYTKRNLADVLEGFALAKIFETFKARNQSRYRFRQHNSFVALLAPLPQFMPSWRHCLEVLLTLRACIQRVENKSEATRVIEIRNVLSALQPLLRRLKWKPPSLNADFQVYWKTFSEWIMDISRDLSKGSSLFS